MAFNSLVRGVGAVCLLLALALVSACANNDSGGTTAPPVLELNSGPIAGSGGVYPHIFANAGNFPYHCTIHAGMAGTIQVDASSPNANLAVSITGNAFVPASSSVQPGGTVTWTNNDGGPHTVTSN